MSWFAVGSQLGYAPGLGETTVIPSAARRTRSRWGIRQPFMRWYSAHRLGLQYFKAMAKVTSDKGALSTSFMISPPLPVWTGVDERLAGLFKGLGKGWDKMISGAALPIDRLNRVAMDEDKFLDFVFSSAGVIGGEHYRTGKVSLRFIKGVIFEIADTVIDLSEYADTEDFLAHRQAYQARTYAFLDVTLDLSTAPKEYMVENIIFSIEGGLMEHINDIDILAAAEIPLLLGGNLGYHFDKDAYENAWEYLFKG